MADSNLRKGPWPVLLALLAWAGAVAAAPKPQTIVLDAKSFDSTVDNIVFHKVKITQGRISISADQGEGNSKGPSKSGSPDFDNSVWVFRGNVKVTMNAGQLSSDEAQITFLRQQLTRAVATGDPAVFEDEDAKSGKTVHGRADAIDYDAVKGVVSLLKNAWLSDGQYEVRGDSLKYNALSRTIHAEGTEQNTQRVHIVVPPPPSKP